MTTARGARKTFRKTFREAAAIDILKRLLHPADDIAMGYTWALYVPDKYDRDLLIPLPLLGDQERNKWRVGTGVTGTAYASSKSRSGRTAT